MRWIGWFTFLLVGPAFAQDVHVRVSHDVTTGIAGTTEFPTIQNALDHHPFPGPGGRVYLEIEPGVYRERINVTQNHWNVTLIGKGAKPEDVVITNSLNAKTAGGTFFTETAEIDGEGFEADNLTIENTAGNTGQAVAAAVRADKVVFKHVRLLGHQDTLFADFGRQYYVDSYIEGGVDFIFGDAAAVFDHCELHANGPGALTAQSRTRADETTGYVILHSRVTSGLDPSVPGKTPMITLGRPWRAYARTVFIDTELPADLNPVGFTKWAGRENETTAYYGEAGSTGAGAAPEMLAQRNAWIHKLTPEEVKRYQPRVFLAGKDRWNAVAAAAKLP
jgi:pectinesterase